MSAALLAALLLAAAARQGMPDDEAAEAAAEALEREVLAQDDSFDVTVVSQPGEPELLDVVAHGAPAHEVLAKIARDTRRELRLDAGDAALLAANPIDVHLKRRPLREVVEWVAGASGLYGELLRASIRIHADRSAVLAPEEALQRAIDGWNVALLRDPLQADAPRLRFMIGNARYQMGDFVNAILVWKQLEEEAPRAGSSASRAERSPIDGDEFGDLPLVYFRCGHAHAAIGDEAGAQTQWLTIAEKFPTHPLVASARLEAVKSFRRQGDEFNANLVLRLVVEGMKSGLSPQDLVTAGELLNEGGSHERATEALQWALHSNSDPALEERAMVALAQGLSGQRDWHGVIEAAQRYAKKHGSGEHAAEMWMLLGEAHHHLDDPFTALLAIRRARELKPREELSFAIDLLEGRVWSASGLVDHAEPCLSRAGECPFPRLAAPALALHAQLLRDGGQLEAAARLCERLKTLPGREVEAALALAGIYLQQRNRTRCLTLIRDTLPLADGEQRAALNAIAHEALRDAPPDVAWPEFLDTPEAAAPTTAPDAPTKEALDGR